MPVQPQFYQIRLPMGHQGAHHNRVIPADQTAMGALAGALDKGVGAYMQSRQQKIQNENQQRQLDQQEWRDALTNAINQAKMAETVRANKASEQYRTDSMQATADYRENILKNQDRQYRASEKQRNYERGQAHKAEQERKKAEVQSRYNAALAKDEAKTQAANERINAISEAAFKEASERFDISTPDGKRNAFAYARERIQEQIDIMNGVRSGTLKDAPPVTTDPPLNDPVGIR